MRYCPKCGENFKYPIKAWIFRSPVYKLKCDKCNTRIEETKNSARINSIIATIPLIVAVYFKQRIYSSLNNLTNSNFISTTIVLISVVIWLEIIYNVKFPWVRYKVVEHNY